jgi:hypothetical protein
VTNAPDVIAVQIGGDALRITLADVTLGNRLVIEALAARNPGLQLAHRKALLCTRPARVSLLGSAATRFC